MSSKSRKITTIIGNIGSGKSTALPLIAEHLDAHTIQADDLFQTTDPFAKVYLGDMSRWAFANELWLTVNRVKLIKKELVTSKKEHCVIDSGLLMSWVYTYSHFMAGRISKAEWELYQELYDDYSRELLANSAVIFLDYSIPTLLKRIAKRGRGYELKFYTKQYLEELQQGLQTLFRKLNDQVAVIQIAEQDIKNFEANNRDKQRMLEIVSTLL